MSLVATGSSPNGSRFRIEQTQTPVAIRYNLFAIHSDGIVVEMSSCDFETVHRFAVDFINKGNN